MPKNASDPKKIEAKIKKLEDKANSPQGTLHNDKNPNADKRGREITQEDRDKLRVAIEGLRKKLAKIHAAPQEGISRAASHAGTSYGGHSVAPSEFGTSASQAGNGKAGKASHKIVATNKTWAMIPPPMLDATAYDYVGSGVKINKNLMAYELYTMDRATRTFYVKSGEHSHIAYVPFQNGLSMEHSALKTESENLDSTNPGYIYHSDVYEYQQGDVKKYGYITLLIPFVHQSVSSDQAGEYVCAVQTIDHDASNINSTFDLFQTYKEYIFSSSIPANSTITQLDRLKKYILDLTNSKIPRELHRTDNKLSDQVVRSHLTLKDQKKLHIQIAIAYTNKEIAESLFLSPRTVETHRARILKKLDLKNSLSLVKYINESFLDF
jgi:DNA-binding CsgD family transcriptional regulator